MRASFQDVELGAEEGTGPGVPLLFADDTLVSCDACQDHLVYLCWILM